MKHWVRTGLAAAIAAGATLAVASAASARNVAYVPLGDANALVIVDTDTDKVVGRVDGLPGVHGLAGTPDGRFLIAGSNVAREKGKKAPPKPKGMSAKQHEAHHKKPAGVKTIGDEVSTLTILRTSDNAVVRRVDVPGGVHHVAVSPDGRLAVVTHPAEGTISAIDLETFKLVANVPTGALTNYVAFSPDGAVVYVSNAGNGTVSAVDTKRWYVRWNAVVGESPEHLVLSKDGRRIYVNNVDDGSVSILDTGKRAVVKTIKVGEGLHGIDLADDGKTLIVAALGDDKIVSIDLASGKTRTATLKPTPYHLATVRGTGKVYVSSSDKPKIWVVDQKSLKVLGEIPIGGKGHQIVQGAAG